MLYTIRLFDSYSRFPFIWKFSEKYNKPNILEKITKNKQKQIRKYMICTFLLGNKGQQNVLFFFFVKMTKTINK